MVSPPSKHHPATTMSVAMSNTMDDDVADLVLTPFRDIVDKGKTAIVNAGDAQPMLKASQSLVKEGERALKRIEPLCKKNLDEYGPNFLAALKENGACSSPCQRLRNVCLQSSLCPVANVARV